MLGGTRGARFCALRNRSGILLDPWFGALPFDARSLTIGASCGCVGGISLPQRCLYSRRIISSAEYAWTAQSSTIPNGPRSRRKARKGGGWPPHCSFPGWNPGIPDYGFPTDWPKAIAPRFSPVAAIDPLAMALAAGTSLNTLGAQLLSGGLVCAFRCWFGRITPISTRSCFGGSQINRLLRVPLKDLRGIRDSDDHDWRGSLGRAYWSSCWLSSIVVAWR